MSDRFKVFGLQRSGTNVVHKLLCSNFDVVSLDHQYGWKHGSAEAFSGAEPEAVLIHCVRNPLAWAESCYRFFKFTVGIAGTDKRFDATWSFQDFLRRPHYEFSGPLERWNQMNRHWITAHPGRTLTVRDELVYDGACQSRFIAWVQEQLSWRRKPSLSLFHLRVTPVGTLTRQPMDSTYYVERQYMARYSPEDLLHCQQLVDWELARLIGFTNGEISHGTD